MSKKHLVIGLAAIASFAAAATVVTAYNREGPVTTRSALPQASEEAVFRAVWTADSQSSANERSAASFRRRFVEQTRNATFAETAEARLRSAYSTDAPARSATSIACKSTICEVQVVVHLAEVDDAQVRGAQDQVAAASLAFAQRNPDFMAPSQTFVVDAAAKTLASVIYVEKAG